MPALRSFASDNNAGVHPAVLKALVAANAGPDVVAYGGDMLTRKVEARLAREFGAHSAHIVLNGAAANVLCMAAGLKAHQAALCAQAAHVANDEGGATERFVGCKLIGVKTENGKFTARELERALDSLAGGRVLPRLVSVTQCTEVGTVYSLSELKAISKVCRRRGLLLHMDGARLSNAAARLGVSLKRLTRGCGVDLLSFGLTKNGALMADAVVIFDRELDEGFRLIRMQGLQLASKQRFMAAQFAAMLDGGLWLENARRANEAAALLAREARRVRGVELAYPVETNAVFVRLPRKLLERFGRRRFFYVWDRERSVARWMCSFATTARDVRAFVADLRRCGGPGWKS
jgi:threonine aldolase